jgi:hypothetical protein
MLPSEIEAMRAARVAYSASTAPARRTEQLRRWRRFQIGFMAVWGIVGYILMCVGLWMMLGPAVILLAVGLPILLHSGVLAIAYYLLREAEKDDALEAQARRR